MSNFPVREELARGYAAYFRARGSPDVSAAGEILPVVLMDDNSRGPYPAYRSWMAGTILGLVAAQHTFIGIQNSDDVSVRSAVVVDEVILRNVTATDDWILGLTTVNALSFSTLSNVADCAPEKEQTGSFAGPALGNVQLGTRNAAAPQGSTMVPGGPITTSVRVRGPWILGPQGVFFIRPLTIAESAVAYFRGRYYSAL